MIKNHQTTIGIVEKGIQEQNSFRIELLGPQALSTEPKYATLNLTNAQRISDVHEVGTYIFYTVEKNTATEIVGVEKGIGLLEKEEEKYYIDRLVPISQGKKASTLNLGTNIADFEATRDTFLVIGTSAPSNINELLFLPHSIASSNDKGLQTTPLPLNSLLGRLNGDIQAIDDKGLAQLIEAVSLDHIRLEPKTAPENPTKGMIYYDKYLKELRKYNGKDWCEIYDGGNF